MRYDDAHGVHMTMALNMKQSEKEPTGINLGSYKIGHLSILSNSNIIRVGVHSF